MSEREKVKSKIQALLNKTTGNGCTLEEAMAAAKKAGELMDFYQIQITELEIREESCKKIMIEKTKKKSDPMKKINMAIAHYCQVKTWTHGNKGYVYFGLPQDVEMAEYLHEFVLSFVSSEMDNMKNTKEYMMYPYHKRRYVASFLAGLQDRVYSKLNMLGNEREAELEQAVTKCTDLVIVKEEVIDRDFDKLGIKLRNISNSRSITSRNGYNNGDEAGRKFSVKHGIGSGNKTKQIA